MPRGATDLTEKREKLEAELAAVKAQEEVQAEQKAVAVGRAVLAEAATDQTFKETLDRVLAKRLKKTKERKLFGLSAPPRRRRAGGETTSEAADNTVS